MKKVISLFLLTLFASLNIVASNNSDTTTVETKITLKTATGDIFGTLTTPEKFNKIPVALIIAGSGPTDRDGNNSGLNNNSLKMLSAELLKKGIATLRYDKRGIAESKAAMGTGEASLRFDDYVNDAKGWIQLLKQDKRFSKVIVIGHSEGSLIGMIAATSADQYVSIAGPGQSADKILKIQLGTQPKIVTDVAFPILDSLKNGFLVKKVDPMLISLFRPSVQPYLISWFKYDPQVEIKKLSIPVLILQGTNDIQVSVDDAKLLAMANPKSHMVLIDKMNHVFKIVDGDRQANIKTYSDPTLPISVDLAKNITDFILKN
jgi:pimeloyl-ACP methyl ester carboxylesterase